jgi:hypothetical protein
MNVGTGRTLINLKIKKAKCQSRATAGHFFKDFLTEKMSMIPIKTNRIANIASAIIFSPSN